MSDPFIGPLPRPARFMLDAYVGSQYSYAVVGSDPEQWISEVFDPALGYVVSVKRPIGWDPPDGDTPLTQSQLKRRRRRHKAADTAQ